MDNRNALGIIELASIYKGFHVQDEVLKSADVEKLVGTPGKLALRIVVGILVILGTGILGWITATLSHHLVQ